MSGFPGESACMRSLSPLFRRFSCGDFRDQRDVEYMDPAAFGPHGHEPSTRRHAGKVRSGDFIHAAIGQPDGKWTEGSGLDLVLDGFFGHSVDLKVVLVEPAAGALWPAKRQHENGRFCCLIRVTQWIFTTKCITVIVAGKVKT